MADRFPFMRVYKDMAGQLSREDRADFYDALIAYALDDEEPAPSTGAAVFQAARRMVDKWKQTAAAGRARADKTAGRSLDGRWKVAGSEKPAERQKSKNAGSEKPAKEEKNKSIKDKKNILSESNKKNISEHENKTAAAGASAQDVIDLYNAICISLPKAEKVTKTRADHIKARLKENALEEIRTAFEKAEASDFLTGRIEGKTWRADFDWITGSPTHFQRILEGVYDNRRTASALDAADRVAEALIGSASPEAVAEFEKSMNGGYTI